eukprot:s1036_g3.t1
MNRSTRPQKPHLPGTCNHRAASGSISAPRRWAGPQLRVVVLTKDAWLHCFHLEASRLQALSASASAGGGVGADVHGTGVEGLEALEAEPQWSLFVPHCNVVAPVAGKARLAWIGLYGDLLGAGLTAKALRPIAVESDMLFAKVGFRICVAVASLLVLESFLILVYGTVVYGFVFLHQKAFVLGLMSSVAIITVLLLARYSTHHAYLIYAVPVCAAGRLLLIPVIRAEREKFTRVADRARDQRSTIFASQRIVDAINESPERVLNVKQRDRLLRLAEHQDSNQSRGFWGEADVSRFLRDASAVLSEHSGAAGTASLLSGAHPAL